MNLQRPITWVLSATIFLFAASCQKYTKADLDNSVDAKINALIVGYVDELTGSEYGWMVSLETSKGFYRFWMDFDENNIVTMMTDNPALFRQKEKSQKSTYVFKELQRPTLIFDTYNYLHVLNDPENAVSGGTGDKGLRTDFEFEVERWDKKAETFYMKGRFNKVKAIFRKAGQLDKMGAMEGNMMDNLNTFEDSRWNHRYFTGEYQGHEIALKLADNRSFYRFAYDNRTHRGSDGTGYYNAEVDGSNDIFLPTPVKVGDTEITGIRFDHKEMKYSTFVTSNPGMTIPVDISEEASARITPADVFGLKGSGKMYDVLSGAGIKIPSGYTNNILDFTRKMLEQIGKGTLNLLTANLEYSFVKEYRDENDPTSKEIYLYISLKFTGFSMGIFDNPETGKDEAGEYRMFFPEGLYKIKTIDFDPTELVFTLDHGYRIEREDADANYKYYDRGVISPLIDGLLDRTFQIKWSKIKTEKGLVVDFVPIKADGTAPKYDSPVDIILPAVMMNSGKDKVN